MITYIKVTDWNTPKITGIAPFSGLPGTFLSISGDFKTYCYLRDSDGCADDSGARITRLFVGSQQCQLINTTSNELFQEVTQNLIKCQFQKNEVGYHRASMLVSNEFGRALTSKSLAYISPDQHIYNFQAYAGKVFFKLHISVLVFQKKNYFLEITSISPQTGSVEGGTRITIVGKYLYHDANVPAQIDIAGSPCNVVDFDMSDVLATKIVCETSPSVVAPTDNYGNRGIILITQNVVTSASNLGKIFC